MLKKLRAKWKVNGINLLLIILTFAIGGSVCGWVGRRLLLLTGLEKNTFWVLLYVLIIILLWPVTVLIISVPLGQFSFFKTYVAKLLSRKRFGVSKLNKQQKNIAIFASGAGSNAENIISYFKNDSAVTICLIVTNKAGAGVIQISREHAIPYMVITKEELGADRFILQLTNKKVDLIILAGFLLKLPPSLVHAFPTKIINIHPALLPAYGGKGMYGSRVHNAVISNEEKKSGITIHYVDEKYDHGPIIFQTSCDIAPTETAETLAEKIHLLEHVHYPQVIRDILKSKKQVK